MKMERLCQVVPLGNQKGPQGNIEFQLNYIINIILKLKMITSILQIYEIKAEKVCQREPIGPPGNPWVTYRVKIFIFFADLHSTPHFFI